jgi:hypothetical protein
MAEVSAANSCAFLDECMPSGVFFYDWSWFNLRIASLTELIFVGSECMSGLHK